MADIVPNTLAHELAAQAMAVRLDDFGPEVIEKARLCLTDYFACALESRDLPWSRQASSVIATGTSGAGLIGRGCFTAPADAAFANAVAGHGLVREDMHAGAIAHLGVVIWPVLMACAGRERTSGAQLLAAAVVGYELGARLGRALMTPELARLFRPTGLVGAPAGAIALAYLCRADVAVAGNGFALAANTVAGLNEWPHTGGSEMYFHPGFAARNAVTAHDLARAGAIASPSILEGEAGLFAAYARSAAPTSLVLFADGQTEILAVFNKEVPACNFAQTPCQVALRAAAKIDSGEISRVLLRVTQAAEQYPGCNAVGPFDYALQAKMSIPFGVAATLARGEIAEANYDRLEDLEIARLIEAIELVVDPELTAAFPAQQGSAIRIELADGRVIEDALSDVVPASPDLIRKRFMANAVDAWGQAAAETVQEMISNFEHQADAALLDRLCAEPARGGHSEPAGR